MAKLYGLLTGSKQQMALIEAHCFGDCGKIAIGMMESPVGLLLICTHEPCPYLKKQLDEPCGESAATGEPIYLRALETPNVEFRPPSPLLAKVAPGTQGSASGAEE